MPLEAYHQQIIGLVKENEARLRADPDAQFPVPELVFADLVMENLQNVGMIDNYDVCHWAGTIGRSKLRVSGHAISADEKRLDLLITHYSGEEKLQLLSDAEATRIANSAMLFIKLSAEKKLLSKLDSTSDVYRLVDRIEQQWSELDQVRILLLTDARTNAKHYKGKEISAKSILVEAIDIERLHRHMSGNSREEIELDFTRSEGMGGALACVHVSDPKADYDYALAAIPGEVIYALYSRHNTRLLEANVRTFLGNRSKTNKGIAQTLEAEPGHFMAYNNGLVIICEKAEFGKLDNGTTGISHLSGLQIVNGGQTTSSLYFAKRDRRSIDLSHVRVPVKIIILKENDQDNLNRLVSSISRFANTQNTVKNSDLSANRPFHIQLEQLSKSQWCPDGVGRWFYERATGSYNVLLMREGTSPARRRKIKEQMPTSRKLTKNEAASVHEAWRQLPAQVALAGEKNFAKFMAALDETPEIVPSPLDIAWYRELISKVIIFRTLQSMIKTRDAKQTFMQSQVNISTYVLSVVAYKLERQINFEEIWRMQALSPEFKQLLYTWAEVVNQVFSDVAKGRQFSEVAKSADLWRHVRDAKYPEVIRNTPEVSEVRIPAIVNTYSGRT